MATEAAVSSTQPAAAEHPEPNYIAVFIYLAILTAVELAVYAAGFPQVAKVGLLVALAWAKAVLVAMYFMHLAMERRALWIIALTPVMLVTFLCFMLMPDLTSRIWAHVNEHISPSTVATEATPPPAP
jgi:caa(3)-type oxidase subunit IV